MEFQKPQISNPQNSESANVARGERSRLQLFRAGSLLLAVPESDIAAIVDWKQPTPLPQAPSAIKGVVSVHGRMLTVLDPLALLAMGELLNPQKILALQGEEQLALALTETAEVIELKSGELQPSNAPVALGTICHNGDSYLVLNTARLFQTAIQGRDRRRRRF